MRRLGRGKSVINQSVPRAIRAFNSAKGVIIANLVNLREAFGSCNRKQLPATLSFNFLTGTLFIEEQGKHVQIPRFSLIVGYATASGDSIPSRNLLRPALPSKNRCN